MKTFVLAFFLMVQLSPAMDKEQIISGFIDAVKKYDVVQYSISYTMTDESKGDYKFNYKCAEKFIPADTTAGGYYNLLADESQYIYCGADYYEYYPKYYGEGIVCTYNKNKHQEDFNGYEIEIGGIKGYTMGVLRSHSLFNQLLVTLAKQFNNKFSSKESITTKDSTINGRECYILRISGTEFYAFDKINFMPLYYYCNNQVQWHEVFYSDYKFNDGNPELLFSRKAFPSNYKFKHNPPTIKKKSLTIGKAAPPWELMTLTDKKTSLLGMGGKPLLLVFSEIGCLPCMAAIPDLNDIAKKYTGINVLAVYPLDSKEALQKFSRDKKYAYDILYNSKETAKNYYVTGYPTFFLIDKNGILRESFSGYGDGTKKEIEKKIEKLLK
jgi:thiol-disulfide isomerase/thioredoxin